MIFLDRADVKLASKLSSALYVLCLSSVSVTINATVRKHRGKTVQAERQRKVGVFYDNI